MKAREVVQLVTATAALLGAAGSFVKQLRGETAQAAQDQNVALTAGELAGEIRELQVFKASVKPECLVEPKP